MVNIALTTIVIFILLVFPGIVFRRCYFRGPFSSEYFKTSWAEVFVFTVVPGVLFQIVIFGLISLSPRFYFDEEVLATLLSSSDYNQLAKAISKIRDDVWWIVLYNLSVWASAGMSGYVLHAIVRKLDLDRKLDVLKFKNGWHYLFEPEDDEKSIVVVDILIKQENKSPGSDYENKHVIITGILSEYKLNSTDVGLEYVVVYNATRHTVNWDSDRSGKKDNYYVITGSSLLIPYNQIINMNVTFVKRPSLSDDKEGKADDEDGTLKPNP